ncbi:MAG TPA: RtcB family protein [Bacteriovoracaceae bacterium]|nr:RtcB family protein [Bacteriovoracaceae bacterium]
MKKIITDSSKPIKLWSDDVDDLAESQLRNVASLPFIHSHVAAMADVHVGKGSTVGTVIATDGAVLPSAVGVDIGCGMIAVRFPFKVDILDNLKTLRHSLEKKIPVGRGMNRKISDRVAETVKALGLPPSIEYSNDLHQRSAHQLGSLGTGNHFLEVCTDQENYVWAVLHSGSRNIGKELADIHINKAMGLMREGIDALPHPDLAYLLEGTPEFQVYIGDMHWAQNYAKANRNEMMLRMIQEISLHVYKDKRLLENAETLFRVDCHHNYCQRENHFGKEIWLTRKGAVSAKKDEFGIIPGSMGTKSYIVKGKGNPDSFESCSHGAGRKMSRTAARAAFTESDLVKQTEGIECRKDNGVVDEIPSAYKDIDEVMENQKDLVDPIFTLRQLICVKG